MVDGAHCGLSDFLTEHISGEITELRWHSYNTSNCRFAVTLHRRVIADESYTQTEIHLNEI